MENEVKEILEVSKKLPTLPVALTRKAKRNLTKLQGEYQARHNKKINLKDLGTKIFETATLPA